MLHLHKFGFGLFVGQLVHESTCLPPRAEAVLHEVKTRLRAGTQLRRGVCKRTVCPHFALLSYGDSSNNDSSENRSNDDSDESKTQIIT